MRILLPAALFSMVMLCAACSGGDDDDDGGGAPAAPSGLAASLVTNQPHLTWSDNSDDEEGFDIERMVTGTGAFAVIYSETFNIEQYHDMDVEPATSYTYRVIAVGAESESAPSNEVTIATP